MRVALRFLGLDLLEFSIETDDQPDPGPGDTVSNPVGFSVTERLPEFPLPDRE